MQRGLNGPVAQATDLLIRKRGWALALVMLMTLGFGAGLPSLGFDFSPQQFFETGDDDDRFLNRVTETFGHADNMVMVVVRRPGGRVLDAETLKWIDETTARLEAEPWVNRARGLTRTPVVRPPASEFDDLRVEPLGVGLTEAQFAGDPLIDGLLINAARDATALLVKVDERYRTVADYRPLMKRLDALLAERPPPDGAEALPYGLPYVRVEAVGLLQYDQMTRLPAVAVLFIVILWLLFRRRFVAVVAPFAAIVITLLWLTGSMGHFGRPVNLLSNVLPMLIFVIGVSDAIHLMARYAEEVGTGKDARRALHTSTVVLTGACFLTSFTTAVGFASLVVARTAVLSEFGLLAALGVMFAYVTTILLVPVILSWFAPLTLPLEPEAGERPHGIQRPLTWLAASVVAHPWRWMGAMVMVLGLAGLGMSQVVIDSRVHEAFHEDSPIFERQMAAEQALGGLLNLSVSVVATEQAPEGVDPEAPLKRPDVLRRLWALQQFVEGIDGIGGTLSPATFVRALWVSFEGIKPMGADPVQTPNLPKTQPELAQIMLLGELGGGLPWDQVVTPKWDHLRLYGRLEDRGSRYFLPKFQAIQAEADRLFEGVPGVEVRLSGEGYMASMALQYFIEDLLSSLGVAAAIIFLAMTLLFRSLRLGLVAVLPNFFPLMCTFGFMGFAGFPLNSTTMITFSISLGLAVDDTIHFLSRFREARVRLALPEAIEEALIHTGRPIVMTTVLLCLGNSVLLSSAFLATRDFALLIMVAVACALPGDLILLPALLRITGGRQGRS